MSDRIAEKRGPAARRWARRSPFRRVVAPGSTIVLFIGGTGRSGSTLLERLVGKLDGVVTLGEVTHLWLRGIRNNELCACSRAFADCPFWTEVGERAFGGWSHVDVDHVLALKDRVDRQRRVPRTTPRRTPAGFERDVVAYAEYFRRVYDAAAVVSGADVVVDSSKEPPIGLALSHDLAIDLRTVHITRDSRGVAYSWSKAVARPETRDAELMPQLSALSSTAMWSSHNLSIQGLRYRQVPVVRIRYEDLVLDPARIVREFWAALGLPGSGALPMTAPRTLDLGASHSVAGNPMRFAVGPTELRPDTEWQTRMAPGKRRLVTWASFPLLVWLGYLPRRRP